MDGRYFLESHSYSNTFRTILVFHFLSQKPYTHLIHLLSEFIPLHSFLILTTPLCRLRQGPIALYTTIHLQTTLFYKLWLGVMARLTITLIITKPLCKLQRGPIALHPTIRLQTTLFYKLRLGAMARLTITLIITKSLCKLQRGPIALHTTIRLQTTLFYKLRLGAMARLTITLILTKPLCKFLETIVRSTSNISIPESLQTGKQKTISWKLL